VRKSIVAGNWKMNLLIEEARGLASAIVPLIDSDLGVEVVLCPTLTALWAVREALTGQPGIAVGGQNCYTKESGAYTAEISPQMLMDAGCEWTIIGHSERRQYFRESDQFLNEKAHFALASGLKVMFCIGETLEEREKGQMNDVIVRQIEGGLGGMNERQFDRIVIAYEPVWAIGTGVTATPEQAQDAHAFVRGIVSNQFGETIADELRIQYGGSVKPDNAEELMTRPDVDGALVGGASLDAESFAAIVRHAG
jgi:triosephosphate isomerase